ncbi:ABC transporter substrate-binding protein [Nonomuraea sp. NPDC050404]|uniref:ABC transporter substrate-binding protein n=1 Tax=Nonomuraea sp. NPDC050404 TaxID=3155783 RepID=UPI003405BD74
MLLPAAPGASAMIDPSKGKPGFCQDGTGVTVVVDFQQLGGTTIVRCNPQPERGTGLDALKGAGFQIAGVQRWGEAFICRIENRPSAVEKIPVTGNENYMEACIDTPPAAGYWSYWHAGNNCAWKYSQWGVKNRDFVAGGFEGWSFSLNATAETNPKPRIAAVRPGTEGGSCDTPDEPAPTTNDPSAVQPGSGGDDPPQDPPRTDPDPPAAQDPAPRADQNPPAAQDPPRVDATPSTSPSATPLRPDPDSPAARDPAAPDAPAVQDAPSTDPTRWEEPGEAAPPQEASRQDGSTLPRPLPRRPEASVADDPAHNVAFVGGQDAPDITEVVKEQSGASDYAPWAAAAATVALGAATWLTARRRRRSRDA